MDRFSNKMAASLSPERVQMSNIANKREHASINASSPAMIKPENITYANDAVSHY
jgi:hypothetical protein